MPTGAAIFFCSWRRAYWVQHHCFHQGTRKNISSSRQSACRPQGPTAWSTGFSSLVTTYLAIASTCSTFSEYLPWFFAYPGKTKDNIICKSASCLSQPQFWNLPSMRFSLTAIHVGTAPLVRHLVLCSTRRWLSSSNQPYGQIVRDSLLLSADSWQKMQEDLRLFHQEINSIHDFRFAE